MRASRPCLRKARRSWAWPPPIAELILDLQCRKPVRSATLDIDATVIASSKRSAKHTFEGERGYQPVLALWAEQDVIVADEFRDGNVPAGCGNARMIEKAVAALPGTFDKIYVRGDSALYEHEAMTFMDERAIAYAISADMSAPLKQAILALPNDHWKPADVDAGRGRQWAEVNYLPDDGVYKKDHVTPRRYLAIRVRPAQGELLGEATASDTSASSPIGPIRRAAAASTSSAGIAAKRERSSTPMTC